MTEDEKIALVFKNLSDDLHDKYIGKNINAVEIKRDIMDFLSRHFKIDFGDISINYDKETGMLEITHAENID